MIDQSTAERLLHLHIAEYNALTTRSTYLIAIGASFWTVLVMVLTILVAVWNVPNHALLIWSAGIVAQLFAFGWIGNSWGQYSNIRYIEERLRPAVVAVLGNPAAFWGYERYLSEQRRAGAQWWEYTPSLWSACAVLLVLLGRARDLALQVHAWPTLRDLTWLDWGGMCVNLLCFPLVLRRTIGLVALRRSFFPGTSLQTPHA
jgi:hypothetical protein